MAWKDVDTNNLLTADPPIGSDDVPDKHTYPRRYRTKPGGASTDLWEDQLSAVGEGSDREPGRVRLVFVAACLVVAMCLFGTATAWADDLLGVNPDGRGLTPLPSESISATVDNTASPLARDTIRSAAQTAESGWDSTLKQAADALSANCCSAPASNPPPPITTAGLNWCREWSFQDLAKEVAQYPTVIDINATLSSDLGQCLAGLFPGNGAVWWEGEYAALENEAELVITAFPGDDPVQDLIQGFSLPTQTWIDWFNDSAADVPAG